MGTFTNFCETSGHLLTADYVFGLIAKILLFLIVVGVLVYAVCQIKSRQDELKPRRLLFDEFLRLLGQDSTTPQIEELLQSYSFQELEILYESLQAEIVQWRGSDFTLSGTEEQFMVQQENYYRNLSDLVEAELLRRKG